MSRTGAGLSRKASRPPVSSAAVISRYTRSGRARCWPFSPSRSALAAS